MENKDLLEMMTRSQDRFLELSKICKITVGELREFLKSYDDVSELLFTFETGPVQFQPCTKFRSDNLAVVELIDPTHFN